MDIDKVCFKAIKDLKLTMPSDEIQNLEMETQKIRNLYAKLVNQLTSSVNKVMS